MISIDHTLAYQIVVFFVLLYVLNRLLYRPVMDVLEERRQRTEGTLKEAERLEESARKGFEEYDRRFKDGVAKAQEERARIREKAIAEGNSIVESARRDIQAELEKTKKELERTEKGVVSSLRESIPAISRTIAEKILDRRIAPLVLVVLSPGVVFAGGGAQQGAGGMGWKIFNFLLLVLAGWYVWKRWVKGLLEERSEKIKTAIEEAERVKKEAEQKLKEYEQKMASFEERMEEVRRRIIEEAEAERDRIIKEAHLTVESLREQARRSVEQEVRKARMRVHREVVEMAIEMARSVLEENITREDQERIIKAYIERLKLN